jgi:hypothetical protein
VNGRAGHIIENADFIDAKPVLWPRKTAQTLDASTARTSRLVPQVPFEGGPHRASNIRLQRPEVFNSLRR